MLSMPQALALRVRLPLLAGHARLRTLGPTKIIGLKSKRNLLHCSQLPCVACLPLVLVVTGFQAQSVSVQIWNVTENTKRSLRILRSESPTTDLNYSYLHIVRSIFFRHMSLHSELNYHGTRHFTQEQSKSDTANSSFQVHPDSRCCGASSLRSLVENEVSQVKDINEVSLVLALPTCELTLEGRRAGFSFLPFDRTSVCQFHICAE